MTAAKWSALFFAAAPQIAVWMWLYYRTWMMELEPNAQWSQYVTGFVFFALIPSILLTLFFAPIPKKLVPKLHPQERKIVRPTQEAIQPPQSPYRGYSTTPAAAKKSFSLRDLWEAIKKFLRQERIIP